MGLYSGPFHFRERLVRLIFEMRLYSVMGLYWILILLDFTVVQDIRALATAFGNASLGQSGLSDIIHFVFVVFCFSLASSFVLVQIYRFFCYVICARVSLAKLA